ncbi:MAG: cell wall-binding repeat-containing protein [Candidatus Andersenbacteria bacterium]
MHTNTLLGRLFGVTAVVGSLIVGVGPLPALAGSTDQPLTRLSGTDAITTAVAINQNQFPDGSADHVVIATIMDYADALTATVFAARKSAPMYPTTPLGLRDSVKNDIARVLKVDSGDKDVFVIGGRTALPDIIETQLKALRSDIDVERIEAPDRAATAAAIARKMDTIVGQGPDNAFVLNGWNYPDAGAAGAIGGNKKISATNFPILLTRSLTLPAPTLQYLQDNAATLDNVYVVGGPLGVSDAVFNQIKAIVPGTIRLAGFNRLSTAIAVDRQFQPAPDKVCVVRGYDFRDLLVGGVHAALNDCPLVLVHPLLPPNPDVASYLTANAATIKGGFVYGGTLSVPDNVKTAIEDLYMM